jgi:hypothetical protein
VAAALLLVLLGAANARSVPTWSEELGNLPLAQAGTVDLGAPDTPGAFPERRGCAAPGVHLDVSPSLRVRPVLSICVGRRAWPVLASPYASPLFGWPIAAFYPLLGTSIVRLRIVWLLLAGTTSLWLAWALARRLADERRALSAVFAAAASSAGVYLGALFFSYESFIWIWTATGLLLLAPVLAGERPATTRRAAAAGLAFGLAALTNVKALFLLVPLAVWACREHAVSRRLGRRWLIVAACAVPPPALMIGLARLDPNGGLLMETQGRLHSAEDLGRLGLLLPEVLNAGTFGADAGAFLAAMATGRIERGGAAVWLVAASVALCMATALVRLVARRGSPMSAACGMLVGTFVLASCLLYRQGIPANYSPVFLVFGAAVASAIFDVTAGLARLAGWARRQRVEAPAWAPVAAVAVAAAVLAARTVTRIAAQPSLPTSMNLAALEAAASAAAALPDAPVVTVTTLHAFVLESLTDERVHSVQAHAYFEECARRGEHGERPSPEAVEPCVREHWRALLARAGGRPFQVLAPDEARPHMHDTERAYAVSIVHTLRAEAAAAGLAVRTARDVDVGGVRVMSLYVVEPSPAGGDAR